MGYRLIESFKRRDKYGEEIKPGDVCVWGGKRGVQLCVYEKDTAFGGAGKLGVFNTPLGRRNVAYNSVVVAYDPAMQYRRIVHDVAKELLKKDYE